MAAQGHSEVQFVSGGYLKAQLVGVLWTLLFVELEGLRLEVGCHHDNIPLLETERVVERVQGAGVVVPGVPVVGDHIPSMPR